MAKILKLFILGVFIGMPYSVLAFVQVGTGFNSATGGRLVPSANLGINGKSFAVLGSSTGVATTAYSHSAYSLAGYWTKKVEGFLTKGDMIVGFGAGAFYEHRTFKDSGATEQIKTDFAAGPAFFSQWKFISSAYIMVEGICGMGDAASASGQILGLSYRDHVNFVVGFEI